MKVLQYDPYTLSYNGEADDIGYTVLFLASDESKFIIGQTIQVKGGHYLSNPAMPDFNELMNQEKQRKPNNENSSQCTGCCFLCSMLYELINFLF
nr:SDR family oxidoreductase [Cytobacillus firmus]